MKNRFGHVVTRAITIDDLNGAIKSLHLNSAPETDLREYIRDFKDSENFASQVIVAAARHVLKSKKRVGLIQNPARRSARRSSRIHRAGVHGPRYVRRPSQITRRKPSPRLLARRAKVLRRGVRGYFPNPNRTVKSGTLRATAAERAAYLAKRRRGKRRISMESGTLGDANFYRVRVRGKNKWTALAFFPRGEHGKAQATEYATLLANAHPRRRFDVAWPDPPRKK